MFFGKSISSKIFHSLVDHSAAARDTEKVGKVHVFVVRDRKVQLEGEAAIPYFLTSFSVHPSFTA